MVSLRSETTPKIRIAMIVPGRGQKVKNPIPLILLPHRTK